MEFEKETEKGQESKEISPKKRLLIINVSIVVSYITEYLENVITNILNNEKEIFKVNNDVEDYLVAIIGGALSGIYDGKLNLFQMTVFNVALYYSLYLGIDSLKGEEINSEDTIKNFIIDIAIIYFLLLIYDKLFPNNNDDNNMSFEEILRENIPQDLVVSLYYAFKDVLITKNKIKKVVEKDN